MSMTVFTGKNEHDGFKVYPAEQYTSKTKRNECKNEDCTNQRRECSAYCQECSDKRK